MPKVSVLMTVFNTAPYLKEAIDSILNQSFNDFEFIIIDDKSTDSSREIISSYEDSRIILIENETNLGIVASANLGLRKARGKYIARMDSDDIAVSDRLAVQYRFLEDHKDIFLVAGSFNFINSKGDVISTHIREMNAIEIRSAIPKKNPIHQPTVMWRNEGNIFYREKALYCEDRDLWFRLAQEGKRFYILPDILLSYRVHAHSVSISKKKVQEAFIKKVNEWYYEREKTRVDAYDSFDAESFASKIRKKDVGEHIAATRELKLYFKENSDMQEFRRRVLMFWNRYGYTSWLYGFLYWVASLLPVFILKYVKASLWS